MSEIVSAGPAHGRLEADLKPGSAVVFVDVENLFKPFRKEIEFERSGWDQSRARAWEESVRVSRRAAAQMLPPRARYEEWHRRGPLVARRLVQWFDVAGFTVAENHGRTYGFFDDKGVQAVWQEFVNKRNWNHTLTKQGPDRADRAIISDVELFAAQDLEWYFVGSQDQRLVLAESAKALNRHPHKRLAAILFTWSPQIRDAFRNKAHLQGVSTRLSFWKMYDAVLRAEKQAARDAVVPLRPGATKRDAKSGATMSVQASKAAQERRRAERVRGWTGLSAQAAEAAITEYLAGIQPFQRGGAAHNLLDAIAKLEDRETGRRLADVVGRVSETLRVAAEAPDAESA